MKYLADANVLSEATKPEPNPRVLAWLKRHRKQIVVNPIILGELEYGILTLPAGRRRTNLAEWFGGVKKRVLQLEFDAATAHEWASLLAKLKKHGRPMPIKDSLIAATARQFGLTVATRNVADYRASGVKLVNPFDD